MSCGIARARSFVCDRGHVVPVVPVRRAWSCMAAAAVAAWFLCHSRVVATRRQMLAFAMVLMASHYPDLHNKSVVCIVKPCQPVERSAQQGAAAITEPPLATGLIPVRKSHDDAI